MKLVAIKRSLLSFFFLPLFQQLKNYPITCCTYEKICLTEFPDILFQDMSSLNSVVDEYHQLGSRTSPLFLSYSTLSFLSSLLFNSILSLFLFFTSFYALILIKQTRKKPINSEAVKTPKE